MEAERGKRRRALFDAQDEIDRRREHLIAEIEGKRYGIAPPTFEDWGGALVVTFRAEIIQGAESRGQVGTKSGLSPDQVEVLRICRVPQPLLAMMEVLGRHNRTKFRDSLVKPLIEAGLLELTIPDKPQSRLQKYRLTEEGLNALKTKRG